MRGHSYILLLALLLTLMGCKPALPDGVLSERKMERVLYDFHVAQGMTEHVPRESGEDYESMRYELHQAVFRKHGITQQDFDRSMTYYLSDMDRMYSIYKHVTERLEREADALGIAAGPRDMYAQLSNLGDTANVWADRPLFVVRNSPLTNFQIWSQACDSTWLPGDDVMWRFELKDIHLSYGRNNLYADLVIVYDNDSVRSRLTSVSDSKEVEIRIDNPEGWLPRSVSGHLCSDISADPQQERLYVIFSPALIRFHKPQVDSTLIKSGLPADSLAADSLASASVDSTANRRLSPEEFRDLQPVDRTIDVVKEKPYQAPRRGSRKRFVQPSSPRRK